MNLAIQRQAFAADSSPFDFAALVDALGTDDFEPEVLHYLHETCGVEHYTVYRVAEPKPELIGGASVRGKHASHGRLAQAQSTFRSWTDLEAARVATGTCSGAVVMHEDLDEVDDRALRWAFDRFHIVDRVVMCGRRASGVYAISVLRSEDCGQFTDDELDRLSQAAPMLIAACAKHAMMQWDRSRTSLGFASVEQIENKLRNSDWRLSERELQVSARILYGISALGIALDLGLGEETIATYRKRLYQRLRIGGRHELFQKYLKLL